MGACQCDGADFGNPMSFAYITALFEAQTDGFDAVIGALCPEHRELLVRGKEFIAKERARHAS